MHTERTVAAFGIPGSAGVSAEQNDPVAEVGAFLRREDFAKLLLYLFRLFATRNAQTVRNPNAVGITDHTAGYSIEIP